MIARFSRRGKWSIFSRQLSAFGRAMGGSTRFVRIAAHRFSYRICNHVACPAWAVRRMGASRWLPRFLLLGVVAFFQTPARGRAERPRIDFVRAGVAVASSATVSVYHDKNVVETDSISLTPRRRLISFSWQPGQMYRFRIAGDEISVRAPRRPVPYRVQTFDLESIVQIEDALGGIDTVVRFSPDGRLLAVGSFLGWLRILDAYEGRLLYRQRVSEGMVKQLVWSRDSRRLYVGEQSPDATVFALSVPAARGSVGPRSVRRLWSRRLADDLETGHLRAGDRFGVYSLPAAVDMRLSDDGRLFVAGRHSWSVEGRMRNRSVLYCINADGAVQWRFPATEPLELNVTYFAIDRQGRKLVFLPSRTQAATGPSSVEPGALILLDARDGRLLDRSAILPLRPYFDRAESWDSVAVSDSAQRAAVGLADGRVLLFDAHDDALRLRRTFDLGTPLVIGRVPIAAGASYTRFFGRWLLMQTQNTHVPFGSPLAAQQAPAVHRGANTLTAADRQGNVRWRYRGPFALSGIWCDRSLDSGAPHWLMTACRELPGATQTGQFGLLLFDLKRPGGGDDKLVFYYPTEGPVGFDADISDDGRLMAVVETPARSPDGQVIYGNYRIHIVH